MNRVRTALLSTVLMLVSLGLAVVAGEFLVRWVAPQGVYRFPAGMFVVDAATQYRLAPGFRGVADTAEYHTSIRINASGLREDRDYSGRLPGVFRILAIGDSFTMGVGVDVEQTYVKLQEQLAPAHAGRYEVINGGVPGYSPGQSLAYLETRGTELRPDMVMLSLFVGNDIIESHRQLPFYVVDGYLTNGRPEEGVLPRSAKLYLQTHSHLYRLVWPLIARVLHPSHAGEVAEGMQRDFRAMYSDATDEHSNSIWKAVEARIERFAVISRERQFVPVVVIVPEHAQVDEERWKRAVEAADPRHVYRQEAPGVRIAEICRKHGIAAVDLLGDIRAAGVDTPLYFDVDGHFTVSGNAVAARALSGFLAREVVAAKATHPASSIAWSAHARAGGER